MDNSICALGIDMTEDYVQLAYQKNAKETPKSQSTSETEIKYLIPAALYYRSENNSWYFGNEALFNAKSDKKEVYGFSEIKKSYELLGIYMRKILDYFYELSNAGLAQDGVICVTVEKDEYSLYGNLYDIFKTMGLEADRVRIINHDEAFVYYIINQRRDLWIKDVVLIDFTSKNFVYRKFKEIRDKAKIKVYDRDLSDMINADMIKNENGMQKADELLSNYLEEELKLNTVGVCYLTGVGFYGEWPAEALRLMCQNRRVFKGYNLYVLGACYAANKTYSSYEKKHIFCCKGRTKAAVGLITDIEKEKAVMLSDIGANWYEAGAITEGILDGTDTVKFVVMHDEGNVSETFELNMPEALKRPNRTTRVEIKLAYKNDDEFDVYVKDLGFGDLFAGTGNTVRKTVSVSRLLKL